MKEEFDPWLHWQEKACSFEKTSYIRTLNTWKISKWTELKKNTLQKLTISLLDCFDWQEVIVFIILLVNEVPPSSLPKKSWLRDFDVIAKMLKSLTMKREKTHIYMSKSTGSILWSASVHERWSHIWSIILWLRQPKGESTRPGNSSEMQSTESLCLFTPLERIMEDASECLCFVPQ